MGRLIDADETIKELKRQRDQYEAHDWVNLRESLINDGYDFAITDVEHIPAVEAIPKDQYETRLKADMVVMLTEIQLEIEELDLKDSIPDYTSGAEDTRDYITNMIEETIDKLKGV